MFKKKVVIVVFALALGAAVGYFWGSKKSASGLSVSNIPASGQTKNTSGKYSDGKAALKLDLLKDYINFIYLAKEEIENPQGIADKMGDKVAEISDQNITERFYVARDPKEDEKKIVEFFNYLIDDVKNSLK